MRQDSCKLNFVIEKPKKTGRDINKPAGSVRRKDAVIIQNDKEIGDYFDFILEKYKQEDFDTAIHLLVHAIHKKIFLKCTHSAIRS